MSKIHLDIQLIRNFQHASGAYVACPTFSQYPHSWLRDGSYIAYAMDRVGVPHSARAFHLWVARTLEPHTRQVAWLIRQAKSGNAVQPSEMLPARFSLEGVWLKDDGWPNFQLDGYGQWLWALCDHLERHHETELPALLEPAARMSAQYLEEFWRVPCSDCWEEKPDQQHTATLASIYGGLKAVSKFLPEFASVAQKVRDFILEHCVQDGRFIKSIGDPGVDASLIWISTPFEVVPSSDPRMRSTILEIERSLIRDGGVIRNSKDEYFGAGAWLLLTCFLGWHSLIDGDLKAATMYCDWVESKRQTNGNLPEQVVVSSTGLVFGAP